MADYSKSKLEMWSRRIEEIAEESGLDCYEQEFELVSYEEMTSYEGLFRHAVPLSALDLRQSL